MNLADSARAGAGSFAFVFRIVAVVSIDLRNLSEPVIKMDCNFETKAIPSRMT